MKVGLVLWCKGFGQQLSCGLGDIICQFGSGTCMGIPTVS